MAVRLDRFWWAAAVGAVVLALLGGCGSSLTNTPGNSANAPAQSGGSALADAVTKLNQIAQDSCQTQPPQLVYPNCDRFIAELRSAVTTVQSGANGLPNASAVRATSSTVLSAADAFQRDGCGTGPGAASNTSANRPTCVADLGRVRTGLGRLIEETQGVTG
jgi:hypothetical protein